MFYYLKIKIIASFPYKKFRTNYSRFNQNHSYIIFFCSMAMYGINSIILYFAFLNDVHIKFDLK
jgi:hypothetical protein